MTNKELIEALSTDVETNVVIAKKKKKGYTVFPQVTEVVTANLPIFGDCQVIVFEG